MKDGTYNVDVFMPDEVFNLVERKRYVLIYTNHALHKARRNKHGRLIHLKNSIDLAQCDIIEIDVKNSVCTKILAKKNYNDRFNLILVLKPVKDSSALVVVTVWLNHINDNHSTLNKNRVVNA